MLRAVGRLVASGRGPLLVAAGGPLLFACSAHAAPAPTTGAAVVVGVSNKPGLGFAVAERFARGGHAVGIIGRQQAALEDCKAAIMREVPGARVEYCVCDATDGDQVSAAFDGFKKLHGPCDALIYNLSCRPFPPTNVADVTPERLESDWRTGPYGALLCVQQVLPSMRERGEGTILFTGASASLRGNARFGSFAVAKTGLRSLAQSLAKEVSAEGVHVAHVVIDSIVDMPVIHKFMPDAPKGRMLDPAAAADFYWTLHTQDRRCRSFEADLRPLEAQF